MDAKIDKAGVNELQITQIPLAVRSGSITVSIDGCGTFGPAAIDAQPKHQPDLKGAGREPTLSPHFRRERADNSEGCGSIEQRMSTYPPPGPGGVGRRIEEAVELIEMELRHAVAYVNDAVVPQVRKESISAMRSLAETLQKLADRVENRSSASQQPKDPRS